MILFCSSRAPTRASSRYFLRILTVLACGVFVFVFYFVSGVQQQVKLQVVERLDTQVAVEYRPRCVWPIYWAGQSSKYTVLYNYVPAENVFGYNESITYTTHGTTRFLSHVENIAQRWNGPVSVAIYAPATDFEDTLIAIQYLRLCRSPIVRQLTTFHLFYDAVYQPTTPLPCSLDDFEPIVDCDSYVYPSRSFQTDKQLTYPVNVARNIARISAQTKYVLPSDIELYPSSGLIQMFLDMIARQSSSHIASSSSSSSVTNLTSATVAAAATTVTAIPTTDTTYLSDKNDSLDKFDNNSSSSSSSNTTIKMTSSNVTTSHLKPLPPSTPTPVVSPNGSVRTVYVLPIFEVDKSLPTPENKSELVNLLGKNKVVPFHKYVCPECHRVPKQDDWLKYVPLNTTLSVLYTTKRHKPYQNWEPIYIGTNDEPLYDERLNWEGMSDKMTQAYEMCLLDYNFSILDNAFLVHAPGIKHYNKNSTQWRKNYVSKNSQLRRQIKKELLSKHAPNIKCAL